MPKVGLLGMTLVLAMLSLGSPASAATPTTWGAIGNSITAGVGTTGCVNMGDACPNSYPQQAGDHLHPNDAGATAMAIALTTFINKHQ